MMTENDYELIERYLNGDSDDNEKSIVEARTRSDAEFAEELELQREVRFNLEHQKDIEEVREIIADLKPSRTRTGRLFSVRYQVAAVLLLLLSIPTVWYLISSNSRNNQELFTAYFLPYDKIPDQQIRSDSSVQDSAFQKAFQFYESKEYTEALNGFEERLSAYPRDIIARFFAAQCYLETGEAQKAEPYLQKVIDADIYYAEDAQWYLALTYLRAGNKKKSTALLKQLIASNNEYKDRAKRLLEELN